MSEVDDKQVKIWQGDFGKDYIERNPKSVKELNSLYTKNFGISRTALDKRFLEGIPKDARILEVGSNIGMQLKALQELGFKDLTGIEVFEKAIEESKKLTKGINTLKGYAQDIPFKDNWFDLAFTSGVLIHIHPDNLGKAIDEIVRVSKRFIWGFEYFSRNPQEIKYREKENMLWKNDFASAYLQRHPELKLVKQKLIKYLGNNNVDSMFLLHKTPKGNGIKQVKANHRGEMKFQEN